ncbi:MAG: hypothetical protein B6I22_11775 [Desulfobacteraceae bacterium 4572_123]|nr:MAG: hypothetical protein B6I22_11775 [Desulfobacteraceae bacterium 4572_123]
MDNTTTTLNPEVEKQQTAGWEAFLAAFNGLVRTARIHDDTNRLLVESAKHFVRSILDVVEENEDFSLKVHRGRFYFMEQKLLYRQETIKLIRKMVQYFENRSLPALRFYPSIQDATHGQILTFARILNQAKMQAEPVTWLEQALSKRGISWVDIPFENILDTEEYAAERGERAKEVYSHTLSSLKNVTAKISARKRTGVKSVVRMVQNMVDFVSDEDPILMGLSTIRDYDDYTYTHSVNVAILAMCLGEQIGLPRKALVRLGICGIFHDLGKVDIPPEIINKPAKLDKNEFEIIQRHPIDSVRNILKLQASMELKARILLPPFEHHLKYDLTGYPKSRWIVSQSLFGRILAIADVFDAISSPRVYRLTSLSPDRALGLMMKGAGKEFDPILLKWFVNMLGVYPVGTVLKLDSGELGLVMETPAEFDKARPKVILLEAAENGGFQKGPIINLAQRDRRTRTYLRNVVQSYHPGKFNIQPADFFL